MGTYLDAMVYQCANREAQASCLARTWGRCQRTKRGQGKCIWEQERGEEKTDWLALELAAAPRRGSKRSRGKRIRQSSRRSSGARDIGDKRRQLRGWCGRHSHSIYRKRKRDVVHHTGGDAQTARVVAMAQQTPTRREASDSAATRPCFDLFFLNPASLFREAVARTVPVSCDKV